MWSVGLTSRRAYKSIAGIRCRKRSKIQTEIRVSFAANNALQHGMIIAGASLVQSYFHLALVTAARKMQLNQTRHTAIGPTGK
jgi:hypothetical protein